MGSILEDTKADTEANLGSPIDKMTSPENYFWDLNFPGFLDISDKYRLMLQEKFMV